MEWPHGDVGVLLLTSPGNLPVCGSFSEPQACSAPHWTPCWLQKVLHQGQCDKSKCSCWFWWPDSTQFGLDYLKTQIKMFRPPPPPPSRCCKVLLVLASVLSDSTTPSAELWGFRPFSGFFGRSWQGSCLHSAWREHYACTLPSMRPVWSLSSLSSSNTQFYSKGNREGERGCCQHSAHCHNNHHNSHPYPICTRQGNQGNFINEYNRDWMMISVLYR